MSSFLDFGEVKARVSIEDAAKKLGLQLKSGTNQLRAPCPACPSAGERALVITPSKSAFYCWGIRKGGDQIALAAHVRKVSARDAAAFLIGDLRDHTRTVPESEPAKDNGSRTLQALSYLEHEHEAVDAVGIHPDDAKAIGIGYAAKGMMRGTVAIPIRLPDGTLVGYIGITEATLPPRFILPENVVRFPKTA
jgi:DNA primase